MPALQTHGQIINSLKPGAFVVLVKVPHGGSLEARRLTAGVRLYWRVTAHGKTDRVPVGFYDSSAPPRSLKPTPHGYSVAAALHAADHIAKTHADTEGGHRAAAEAQRLAKVAAEAQATAQRHTLADLMADYCLHLKDLKRSSYSDVASIFFVHVTAPWPDLADLPSHEVTTEQVTDIVRAVQQAGKGRTANKLRSYLRAAYEVARVAKYKPSIPERFKAYGIKVNPVADTVPEQSANRADKRPLPLAELRTYWRAIRDRQDFKGAVLRFHLLTGGQRIAQLVRLRTAAIKGESITLLDAKGRPGSGARAHMIPLTPSAVGALKACNPVGEFALSTTGGDTHVAPTTLSAWAVEAAPVELVDFQAKRIRSAVETVLASARVSRELRGRLQSHGVSGVQDRSYDAHDYMAEKRESLEILFSMLEAD